MKKLLVAAVVLSFSFVALAQTQPKHIISIGTDGLGWSGLGTKFDWDKDKSGVKDQDFSHGNLALNYNYVFSNRVMIGAELFYEMDKNETKYDNGRKVTDETTASSFALSVGYNFNEDVFNSWWIKGSIGGGSIETEEKDTANTPQKSDSDIGVQFVSIEIGKRFSFDSWGLKNFSYSPSILVGSSTYDEDADDAGLDSSGTFQINILKFDILF